MLEMKETCVSSVYRARSFSAVWYMSSPFPPSSLYREVDDLLENTWARYAVSAPLAPTQETLGARISVP